MYLGRGRPAFVSLERPAAAVNGAPGAVRRCGARLHARRRRQRAKGKRMNANRGLALLGWGVTSWGLLETCGRSGDRGEREREGEGQRSRPGTWDRKHSMPGPVQRGVRTNELPWNPDTPFKSGLPVREVFLEGGSGSQLCFLLIN